MAERNEMRSLSRALLVVETLTRAVRPLTLSEIAERVSLSPSTTKRILATLESFAMVQSTRRHYVLGEMAVPMAQSFLDHNPLRRTVAPYLESLSRSTGLTASFFVRYRSERILVARQEGDSPLPYRLQLGKLMPLTKGAGKILVADLDDDTLGEVLTDSQALGYESEDCTLAELRERLQPVREGGYSVSAGEREVSTIALATTVPPGGGSGNGAAAPKYALSLAGPRREVSEKQLLSHLDVVRTVAQEIALRLED